MINSPTQEKSHFILSSLELVLILPISYTDDSFIDRFGDTCWQVLPVWALEYGRIWGYLAPVILSYHANNSRVPFNIFLHLLVPKSLYTANIPDTGPTHGNTYIIQNL